MRKNLVLVGGGHAHMVTLVQRGAWIMKKEDPDAAKIVKDRFCAEGMDLRLNHGADIIHGIGLNKILGTIHIYPTMAEANKYAAGLWKKHHTPEKLLVWVERFHTWMRN